MHVKSANQSEIRLTLETTIAVANGIETADYDVIQELHDAGFSRVRDADSQAVDRLLIRIRGLLSLIRDLPDAPLEALTTRINAELDKVPVSPSLVDHDEIGMHLHWTPATATLDDRVITDILIALAHELCDNGTTRIGRCDASDCENLFFDGTRNHSKRFCADQRCATRTHTADHRARQRDSA